MHPSPLIRGAGLVAAVTLAVAGCGGSGSSGLSKKDLASKANTICSATNQQLKGAGAPPADFATNPVSAAAYLDKVVPIVQSAVSQLNALKPASEVKTEWTTFTSAISQEGQLYASAQRKAHAKDPSGLQDLEKTVTIRDTVTHPAEQKLGLTSCRA